MKELIGGYITGIEVNNDKSILVVKTWSKIFIFEAEADYCSETWFADIIGVKYLIGASVKKVEDTACSVKLITDKGEADIIYHNSSNDYYGGSMRLLCEFSGPLTEITDDWQA